MIVGDMTADANGNIYLTGKYNAAREPLPR